MKKLLLPGILAVFLLPLISQAVPLDVPYQIYVSTAAGNVNSIILSTTNFPSPVASINNNVAQYQWCIENLMVASGGTSAVTIAYSTSTLSPSTTDYSAIETSGSTYQDRMSYRVPYCAPVGNPIVKVNSTINGSTITVQGYLWKGWN